MSMRRLALWVALCGFLAAGLASCNSPQPVELTIFHTNDIHSHLRSAKIDPFGLGGLARLSTLLKQLRQSAPNSLTLDAGDWSEGTMYYNVDVGANMLKFLGMMGYDGACLGNHDFLNGPDQIIKTIQASGVTFPVMAANLDMSAYPSAATLLQVLPPTAIKTINGIKVGMIGLTTYQLLYNSYIAPVNITNEIDAATRAAAQLRPQVDVLLVISHNSFGDNVELARAVPGIDAVISGHSHAKTPQPTLVTNAGRQVPVVEAGEWGKFLGELKLSVDPSRKMVQFKSYALHPVTSDIAEDPVVAQAVNDQDAELNAKYHDDVTRVVAQADFDLIQNDNMETGLGNLAVKAYRATTGADVALEEISLTGVSVAKGPATLMDLHDVIPHIYNPSTGKDWTLHLWSARGSDLSLLFNVFYTVDGLMPLGSPVGWLSADNAQVLWDPTGTSHSANPGATPAGLGIPAVKLITIGGRALDPSARYNVALGDGLLLAIRLANDIFHLGVDLSQITDTGIECWHSVVDYATQAQHLTRADIGVGGRTRTTGPDLGIYYYDLDWDGRNLSVEVTNYGMQASTAATLTCSSGKPNDFVDYGTSAQQWTQIGTATVQPLDAGASATIQIPWSSTGLAAGYWPVQCQVSLAGEGYVANNAAQKVFRATGSRR